MMWLFMRKRLMLPKREKSLCTPIAPTNGGMIMGTRSRADRIDLPLKLNLCVVRARGKVRIVDKTVVPRPMSKLLNKVCIYSSF